jgi:hypothetical protein
MTAMLRAASAAAARRHPARLVFGQMFEDAAVECRALPAGRVLCIASAGDTALTLAAAGREVVAVDVNSAQLRYVEHRLAGGPVRGGSVDRLLTVGRLALTALGWSRDQLIAFCELDDPRVQIQQWREHVDGRLFRSMVRVLLSRVSVQTAGFAPFTAGVRVGFDQLIVDRIVAGLSRHPNRQNPYLRRLLTGAPLPTPIPARAGAVTLREGDVAGFLESVPTGSFSGFSLSNVLDAASAPEAARLRAAVRRAAAPGAVAIYRSFRPGPTEDERELARQDRSLMWGSLRIEQVGRQA